MTLRHTLATALIIGLMAPAAFAQSTGAQGRPGQALNRQDGIGLRQRMQQKRIQAGRERGTITDPERQRLQATQQRLRALAQQLRTSDGRLTGRERLRLNLQLNRLSRAIRRAGRG